MAIVRVTGSNLNNAAGSLISVLDAALLPNGWTKLYTGTNKAVYRSATGVTQCCLRVDDSGTTYATVIGYETMTDVDTGVNPFPLSGMYYVHKSDSGTQRNWQLITNGEMFYFFSKYNNNAYDDGLLWFGDIKSKSGIDVFNCALCASPSTSYNSQTIIGNFNGNTSGSVLARSYTQNPGAVSLGRYAHPKLSGFYGTVAYPNPAGNLVMLSAVEVWEGTTVFRGYFPGIYAVLNTPASIGDGTELEFSDLGKTLTGRRLMVAGIHYIAFFDMAGPW